jgi:hypothetical protein
MDKMHLPKRKGSRGKMGEWGLYGDEVTAAKKLTASGTYNFSGDLWHLKVRLNYL